MSDTKCRKFYIDVKNEDKITEETEISVDDLETNFDVSQLEEGDLIDTDGYRGIGLWYFDGQRLLKSSGEYGYFLPAEAFVKVKQFGLLFFEMCGAEFVLIPKEAIIKENKQIVDRSHEQHALAINYGSEDKIQIDDQIFENTSVQSLY